MMSPDARGITGFYCIYMCVCVCVCVCVCFDRLCRLVSELLATDPEVRVRFKALQYFLRSSGSGTGSPQPLEYN
jgi:hypothetical protein